MKKRALEFAGIYQEIWRLPPIVHQENARWRSGCAGFQHHGRWMSLRINAVAQEYNHANDPGMTDAQMEAALLIPIPTRYGRKRISGC